MRITIETNEVKRLFASKEKLFVRRPMQDEIALLISNLSLLLTVLLADFTSTLPFSDKCSIALQVLLATLAISLIAYSLKEIILCRTNPYTTDTLFEDVFSLRLNPFAVYLITDEWNSFPSRYLFAYSARWDGYLLPNHASSWVGPQRSIPSSIEYLMSSLNLQRYEDVRLEYLTTKTLIQPSFSEKDAGSGQLKSKHYDFSFYYVCIKDFPEYLKNHDELGYCHSSNQSYRWMTIDEAIQDENTYARNAEILEALRKEIDETVRYMQYANRSCAKTGAAEDAINGWNEEAALKIIEKHRDSKNASIKEISTTGSEELIPTGGGDRRALIYKPTGCAGDEVRLPVYFDIHGGGFVAGSPEANELFARTVSDELGIAVVCPSYRLAPANKYPDAQMDVLDEILYIRNNADHYGIDPNKMAIGGQSAGGNIAAALSLRAREIDNLDFRCVLLDYPPLDFSIDPATREYPEGSMSPDTLKSLTWAYADVADSPDCYLSPLKASTKDLEGLPPHVIITAEKDCLRTDGESYAERLVQAGVEVQIKRFPHVGHSFTVLSKDTPSRRDAEIEAQKEAVDMKVHSLRRHLLIDGISTPES